MITKKCVGAMGCGKELDISNFYPRKNRDKYVGMCKNCISKDNKRYRELETEEAKKKRSLNSAINKQKSKEKDPIKFKEQNKKDDKNRRERLKALDKEALRIKEKEKRERQRDREGENYLVKKRADGKKRYLKLKAENPEKLKEIARRAGSKARENIDYVIHNLVSGYIGRALKDQNSGKNGNKTFDNLPYTKEELVFHLESLFEPWMKWSNRGQYFIDTWDDNNQETWTWQIDHIIPRSDLIYDSFDHPNFIKCWSLENLRPYSAKQNVLDGTSRVRHKKKDNE